MNKKEFIIEAALRMVSQGMPVQNIPQAARQLADELYPETEPEPEPEPVTTDKHDYDVHPIEMVVKELDRIDFSDMMERRKDNPTAVKVGYATRFHNCCKTFDIDTVGDLLNFGYRSFCKLRNMSKATADRVTQALQNLYGITTW